MEMSKSSGIFFVNKIGMPSRRSTRLSKMRPLASLFIVVIRPDYSDPKKPRNLRSLRVNLNFSKVFSKFKLLTGIDFLITEEDNGAFRHKASKFILLFVVQFSQLQSNKLSSNMFREMNNFLCRTK
jgi:hypothetical protein